MAIVPQGSGAFVRLAAITGLAVLALAGCSSSTPDAAPQSANACPTMSVLSDASGLTRFKDGPGRTPQDVAYDVEVLEAKLICGEAAGGQLTAEVGMSIYVRRGPAGRELTGVTVPYFIAITETNTRVISRANYETQIEVPKGRSSGGIIEHLTVTVPLEGKSPYAFEIIGGIQLTAAELAEARQRRGR